ncbi:MAG: amino acid ABC transporter permease [Promethearchaeota archaeon]
MEIFNGLKKSISETKITRRDLITFISENRPNRYNLGWWTFAVIYAFVCIGFIYAFLVLLGLPINLFDSWGNYLDPLIAVLNIPLSILDFLLRFIGGSVIVFQTDLREFIIVRTLADAAVRTLGLSVLSIIIGFIIAMVLAVILVRPGRVMGIKWLCQAYVDFFRSTPLLVQLFIIYFGVPQFLQSLGIQFTIYSFEAAVTGISLNTAAYQAEIIRGGIQAIPIGQTEAARGLGMTTGQTMRYVILPQALRIVIPPYTNEGIAVILNSSLASIVAYTELTRRAGTLSTFYFIPFEVYLLAAVYYFVMTFSLAKLTKVFERRYRIPGLGMPAGEELRLKNLRGVRVQRDQI